MLKEKFLTEGLKEDIQKEHITWRQIQQKLEIFGKNHPLSSLGQKDLTLERFCLQISPPQGSLPSAPTNACIIVHLLNCKQGTPSSLIPAHKKALLAYLPPLRLLSPPRVRGGGGAPRMPVPPEPILPRPPSDRV